MPVRYGGQDDQDAYREIARGPAPRRRDSSMPEYFGWDIGGVHLKQSRLTFDSEGRGALRTAIEPFEIWKAPGSLADRLSAMLERPEPAAGWMNPDRGGVAGVRHAVTMTAELSDVFPSRAEGVRSVLRACAEALGEETFRVFTLDGDLIGPGIAMERPMIAAAANWAATAHLVAGRAGPSILIDVGSTTTDIIPIGPEGPAPAARDDTGRLMTGELVYTGALRTPPSSLTGTVPLRGGLCRIACEQFCIMADAYLVLGRIGPADYTVPTPDGRGRSRREATARLARLVCADADDLDGREIGAIAQHLERRQIDRIAGALGEVAARHPELAGRPVIVAGAGAFVARDAAARAGREARRLQALVPGVAGENWDRAAPSAALALLLAGERAGAARA